MNIRYPLYEGVYRILTYNTSLRFCMDERSLRFRRNGNVLSTDNDAAFIPLSGLRIGMEELHSFRYSSVPVHALYAVFLFPSFFLYPLFPVL